MNPGGLLPFFDCRIAKADGSVVAERVEAESEKELHVQLEAKGDHVLSVKPQWKFSFGSYTFQRGLSPREFLVFNQELLVLLRSGMSIMKILDILCGRVSHAGFQPCLREVQQQVRSGAAISEAMSHHPSFFPDIYVAAIRSGERSGNLGEVISRYIAFLRRIIAVQKKVVSALSYPAFLMVVGFGAVIFLLTYVMPTFMAVYQDSGTSLPPSTQRLISVVEFFQHNFVFLLLGFLGLLGVSRWAYKTPWGRSWMDAAILKIPLVSAVIRRHYLIMMTRTLATSLAGGVPMVPALGVVSDAITNRSWSMALQTVAGLVREGSSLSFGLNQSGMMPRMSIEMIEVGENSGALVEMLGEVADFHEEELDLYITRLSTWAEPVMLLIMGVIIAVIVVSMYLPIFNLADAVN